MSDDNADQRRTRRRAVRSVGPPVEETASSAVTSVPAADAGKAPAAEPGKPAAASSGSAGPAADVHSHPAAADAPTDAAVIESDTAQAEQDARDTAGVDVVDTAGAEVADRVDGEPVELGKSSTDVSGDDKPKTRSGSRRMTTLAAAAVLVVALLVAGALATVVQAHSIDTRDARRAEYVQTARQAILNLTTIRADSAKEDIDRILELASGQFKNEFDGRVDPFMNIVQQAKVVSNGEIVEAAVESDDDNSAKVLVAAKQTLTNAGQEGPQTRFYRFRVTVSEGDSGLTVSKVEFVA
ncbi:Mce-associated membrane protein [Nocardia tenerifensis]|uniref:Mce-associated membrane protein n=1 Tax=Nocardia tenerifensis TaxID=228006 RepID=A0A318K9L6_9NOCA|nr:hypothetical protein [Nocardia tenerifensis]PXX66952.1 Mce-associated membrane protein [Nocardia tenerifensis]